MIGGKFIHIASVHENDKKLNSLFFHLYTHYINAFNILPDDIWNLDEAGFKIRESTDDIQFIIPTKNSDIIFHDSSELVTALEMFSRTGKVGKPFLIYKGVDQMVSWFPGNNGEQYDSATFPTDFINGHLFHEWVLDHFSSSEDKWSLLLLNRHQLFASDRVMDILVKKKKVIPVYFPFDMTYILQSLDISCFVNAKIGVQRQISHNFGTGLTPTKTLFLESYMEIRNQAYISKTIIEGWKKCGLLENDPDDAYVKYMRRMHHDTHQGSTQEEPRTEAEINEIQPNRRTRKRDPKITKEQLLLKEKSDLKNKIRKLQCDIRQVKRTAADSMTSKMIVEIQADLYRNDVSESEEEQEGRSEKRTRISLP